MPKAAQIKPAAVPSIKPIIMDRSKSIGEITPIDEHGAAYSQPVGGIERFFDVDGLHIHDHPSETAPAKTAAAAKRRRAPIDSEDAFLAEDAAVEPEDDLEIEEVLVGDVNLTAWGKKLVKYRWSQIREAIAARFSKQVANERDAVEFLVEEKVISAREAAAAGWNK